MKSTFFLYFLNALSAGAQSLPCFRDNINGVRTMGGASTRSDTMTNAACKTYCNNLGYAYSGTEYSRECYCSNTLPTEISTQCNMPCAGSVGTNCGGPDALTVSTSTILVEQNAEAAALLASWTNQGCWGDNYPTRVLSGNSFVSSTLTIERCLAYCNNGGFSLAGVEYGSECYCGNSIISDGSTYGVAGKVGCNFGCSGQNSETCGGPNAINLYSKFPTVNTFNPATLFTPTPLTAASYDFQACYSDSPTARILPTFQGEVDSVEECISLCSADGFKYAGLEYYGECFCGNTILGPQTIVPNINCNYKCNGSPAQNCGGAGAIAIYEGAAVPDVTIPQTVNGYQYVDTFVDEPRVLAFKNALSDVTVEKCVSACSTTGYAYAGVEYGTECWCGPSLRENPTGGIAPNMPCAGNKAEYCGGSQALQVYFGTPSPQYLQAPFADGTCVKGSTNGLRTLSTTIPAASNMTISQCGSACQGFAYYGVEYGSECYCGNVFSNITVFSNACNMPCSGNMQQTCGGPDALNIYSHA